MPTIAAEPDATPSPAPASEVRATTRERLEELLREDLPPGEPGEDAAYAEAAELYANDPAGALRAFAAGVHPRRRLVSPEECAGTMR